MCIECGGRVLSSGVVDVLLLEDALFQQVNPGLYTVCIVSNQSVSGQLIFTPTEVTVAVLFLSSVFWLFTKIAVFLFSDLHC